MIKFNIPTVTGKEYTYIKKVIQNRRKLCGDGEFTKKCNTWFEQKFTASKVLLTTSCTHALEMAAILIDTQPGDEIIMPSYTFVSTGNAFLLRGARIVFVDIRPDTMNIDENLIKPAITDKTKAIVPVHYAGVCCDMDAIMDIAERYHLYVVEDAAQGVMSTHRGQALGIIGHLGCFSFHESKNYTMGEGGAILINDESLVYRAEIIREKGTNRKQFFDGTVDKYTWTDIGSSYLPSELNAAFLYAQLCKAYAINQDRLYTWELYHSLLQPLRASGRIELPHIPDDCEHNGHMYYIKCKDRQERTGLIEFLKDREIKAVFHYVPLHSSEKGSQCTTFFGEDRYTTRESERLLRLPLYYKIKRNEVRVICNAIKDFYS